jgi:adenine-specific DNA-methyltransferase
MTNEGDWIFDPYNGVGTTAIAALIHKRKAIGAEIVPEYVSIAKDRIHKAERGELRIRPMERHVYDPRTPYQNIPPKVVRLSDDVPGQGQLLEPKEDYKVKGLSE